MATKKPVADLPTKIPTTRLARKPAPNYPPMGHVLGSGNGIGVFPPAKSTDTNATLKDRASKYGHFAHNSRIMQDLKDRMRNTPNWTLLTAAQKEALEMVAHKIGRILGGDPSLADSWHDIAGYASLVDKILNGENP